MVPIRLNETVRFTGLSFYKNKKNSIVMSFYFRGYKIINCCFQFSHNLTHKNTRLSLASQLLQHLTRCQFAITPPISFIVTNNVKHFFGGKSYLLFFFFFFLHGNQYQFYLHYILILVNLRGLYFA